MISKERHDIHIACKKGKRNLGRKRERKKNIPVCQGYKDIHEAIYRSVKKGDWLF
jgi:hypothetical protein